VRQTYTRRLLDRFFGSRLLSDRFHYSTKIGRSAASEAASGSGSLPVPEEWVRVHAKIYPRLDSVKLPRTRASVLSRTVGRRRSAHEFSGFPITVADLSYLLRFSCGITAPWDSFDASRRAYPSAGARYPLEVYPIVLNCDGVNPGLYHYDVRRHRLEALLRQDLVTQVGEMASMEQWPIGAAVAFVISAVLDRSRVKYGDRGYRYALIESGHVGQNMALLATELGLGCCSVGGFIDDDVNKLLDIQLQSEYALYMVVIGSPRRMR